MQKKEKIAKKSSYLVQLREKKLSSDLITCILHAKLNVPEIDCAKNFAGHITIGRIFKCTI